MIAHVFRNHHDRQRRRSIRARRARVALPLLWDSLEDRRLLNAASLDPTFGNGGVTTTDFPLHYAYAGATSEVIDSSGRIIVAGYASDANGDDRVVLARYNPNGSLDTSFGDDGLVYTPIVAYLTIGAGPLETPSIAIDPRGRIVVAGEGTKPFTPHAGESVFDFSVARFSSNGRIDPSFGHDGLVTLTTGPSPDSSDTPRRWRSERTEQS